MRDQITRLVRQGSDLSLRQLFVLFECAEAGATGVTVKALFEAGAKGLADPVQRVDVPGVAGDARGDRQRQTDPGRALGEPRAQPAHGRLTVQSQSRNR